MKTKPSELSSRRPGERGAALVTALLVSMLLLAAGGALVITTGMSASNAVDSTAEAQAYYAADAGLQAALNVLRRNKVASVAGVKADFRRMVCGTNVPCTNAGSDLSLWLGAGGVVQLSPPPSLMAFSLTVTDPSRIETDILPVDYQPRFLHVRSEGRGPKGAMKVLEMMVDRFKFEYDAPAPLVLRESQDSTNHVNITAGAGVPNVYSGVDVANPLVTKPALCVGETLFAGDTDLAIAGNAMKPPEKITGGVCAAGTAATPWPSIVANAQTTHQMVFGDGNPNTQDSLSDFAVTKGCPGPGNNDPLNGSIFIQGDCTLSPQHSGGGFLVITGTLTMSGNFSFKGLIFVLGSGRIVRSGGGGGAIEGGVLAANYTGNGSGGFGPVVFDTSGGGGSGILYNSKVIEDALADAGPRAVGVVEK